MELKKKLAESALLGMYRAAGMIEDEGPTLEDFAAVDRVICQVAGERNPFEMLMGMRHYNEVPPSKITPCLFDDEQEAVDYCQRMLAHHGLDCEVRTVGFKRYAVELKGVK